MFLKGIYIKLHLYLIIGELSFPYIYLFCLHHDQFNISTYCLQRDMLDYLVIEEHFSTPITMTFDFCFSSYRKERPKLTFALFLEPFVLSLLGIGLTLNMYFASLRYTSPTFLASIINTIASLTFYVVYLRSSRGLAKVLGTVVSLASVLTMTLFKGPNRYPAELSLTTSMSLIGAQHNQLSLHSAYGREQCALVLKSSFN
ncbi:hypothetical protein DVH24_001831 [Malus domestica]|uniref:Uncharacterized protein n=1 Tax=Malus domestica TaxID=3750 RepID=A0A498IB03_MALDO|nr:hypothetical protein DVH24_001831 [Malus domestica]